MVSYDAYLQNQDITEKVVPLIKKPIANVVLRCPAKQSWLDLIGFREIQIVLFCEKTELS